MNRSDPVRRLLAAIAVLAAFALVAVACGDDDDDGPDAGEVTIAQADLARVAGDPTAGTDVARATAAFALDLHHQLVDEGAENLVFSPHSIAVALAMTRVGAVGDTLAAMDATLHLDRLDPGAVDAGFNALDQALAARAGERTRPDGSSGEVELAIANSLWGQTGYAFLDQFLATLAEQYGAGMRLVDYVEATEAARAEINGWVADQTRDRIPELIPEGVLDPTTRLVLTNAVYLYAPWLFPFDETATAPGDFTTLAGEVVQADLMRHFETFGYAELDGLVAVELPYLGDELAMLVIVPDAGRFAEVEAGLDAAALEAVVTALAPADVQLGFPRFEIRTPVALGDALKALGMDVAFDAGRADFSGMTGAADLVISDVVHEAFISVDEEGTEAAAATAVVMAETAAPAEPVELTVDRPFVFALRDTTTGAILFLGRVVDPTR